MSPSVYDRRYTTLQNFLAMPAFGDAYVFGIVYAVSSGVSHSAQKAMAAMLDAAADGHINFVDDCREYKSRCEKAKTVFTDAGFHLVYDTDDGEPVKEENLTLGTDTKLVEDFKGRQLLLFGSKWAVNWTSERNPNLTFSEFGGGI